MNLNTDKEELKDDLILNTSLSFLALFGLRAYCEKSSLLRIFGLIFTLHLLDAILTYLGMAVSAAN